MTERVWDRGLQPERTALAWQRTATATAVAALAVVRLAAGRPYPPGLVLAAGAFAVAAVAVVRARSGYRRTLGGLAAQRPLAPSGPAPLAALAVGLLGLAALALLLG